MSKTDLFRDLHHGDEPLLMPNSWDIGSAKILQHLGFRALATTSSGLAAAHGLLDGDLGADATLAHCVELVAAVDVPVSADLENCYADDPAAVADVIGRAVAAGLAGASVEDWSGGGIYDRGLAAERVQAAVESANGALVITARAENHVRGVDDLDDTIGRLQAFQEAGADVLFAPGLGTAEQIREVVASVDLPVNVLVRPGVPSLAELAELGVRRLSVGGAFAFTAYDALVGAASEFHAGRAHGYLDAAARGSAAIRAALG